MVITSHYLSANGSPVLGWQTSSCLYNLRHQSKSPVSSIHHNSLSHRKVSRKAHLSAYQLLQGKKPIISVDTIFPLEIHGYIFLKNLDKQALYYFKKDC